MKSLTIAYITARKEPRFEWFFDSLSSQGGDQCPVVVVDLFHADDGRLNTVSQAAKSFPSVVHVPPKPTVWQGTHRLTKVDLWAKSNALNTGICLCQTEWIAFVDDRCVLLDGWMAGIYSAMNGEYAVCGSYEKRHRMKVERGIIIEYGEPSGLDHRNTGQKRAVECKGEWMFGCTIALPLKWALAVNGFSEDYCDGLSAEDTAFGATLENSGFPIRYDPTMKIVEDRTPEPSHIQRGEDKGVSPNDKSHRLVAIFRDSKTSLNSFDIQMVRESFLGGNLFPLPSASHYDWYDQQPLKDMP